MRADKGQEQESLATMRGLARAMGAEEDRYSMITWITTQVAPSMAAGECPCRQDRVVVLGFLGGAGLAAE